MEIDNEHNDSLDLYHAYLGNDMAMLSYYSYPYNIHKHQVDEMDFKHKLIQHGLNVQECMAAYYVLTGYKNFDPELVMSALLAWCDPEELVKCTTQEELIEETNAAEIKGNFLYMWANSAASYRSRWYDSPYF